ncbi:protein UL146 [Cynomolgus macaque cytomegalovirus strain Ottawa]|uniref:Protein UL146 n=1 Tax=macacine betaherpesvirus 8 TaxID=2560567 RepID=G8H0S1_9BETA|nr:protein UL146 [Cynomolgus macaque cytomegalovirus strain Ottawa]AEQ32269.1 protein UL146 [Cynomolgus macaque cytomegalovirus strain Ottawa]
MRVLSNEMNTFRVPVAAMLLICLILSGFSGSQCSELRCSCVNYYSGIPWTATCVYVKPKSIECNKYELIVYNGSPNKTCVRVRNQSVFDRITKQKWFKVTKGAKHQLSLTPQRASCAVSK